MIKHKDIVIIVDDTIYILRNGKTALTMEKSQNTVITTDTRLRVTICLYLSIS